LGASHSAVEARLHRARRRLRRQLAALDVIEA
jgi:DNA-directed RNA polymerase specialized sigma24 family protein